MDNVGLIRRGYEAFSRRDVSWVSEFIDPAIEVHEPGGGVEPRIRHEPDGFIASIQNVQDVWDDFKLEPQELVDLGDRVLALVRMSGRGRRSGVPVEANVAHLWTVRDGKVVRLQIWTDWEEARAAVSD